MNTQTSLDFDEVHDVEEPKQLRLSLHLIVKRNLPQEGSKWPQEKIVQALNSITHLRLDRENIGQIDNLELLGKAVTNVYLQQNRIECIENLEPLQGLTFLMLAGNRIRHIRGLMHLQQLAFLDLSENHIQTFDIDELPQSLVILNLKGNPCTSMPDYRGVIIQDLPKLRHLDLQEVSHEERREAGYRVSSSEEDDEEESEDDSFSDIRSIDAIFHQTSADILLRSQSRLEQSLQDHKHRLQFLQDMREKHNLPPSSSRTESGASSRLNTARSRLPENS